MALYDEGDSPRRPRRTRSRARTVVSSLVGTAIIAAVAFAGIWVVNNPQPLIDQVTVWQFEPDAVIAGHAERLQLSDHGRFLYYASNPVVSGADAFATECPKNDDEQEFGILGCYLPKDKTIFLFDVTDERLDGREEVVAAHEMLHAAWDRLSDDEREHLGTLLEAESAKHMGDEEFAKRMDFYARIEPGQRHNELHSIIGTEIADVSPELEKYYSQYFVDRDVVTGLHAASNAVFVELQRQSDALVQQMTALRQSTEADYASYVSGYDELNSDIRTFNRRADSSFFASEAAFTTARTSLMERRDELDALYASVLERQDQYDALASQLGQLNATSAELQRGLNIGGAAGTEAPQ
ncbi:hypothetical protein FB562_1587 [Homoserinimonas aerilata]|uniref:Uncharacterized protein n=1 Tax=Homoserinimonas aerilata TaxID=1162970 RepID=A0A542YK68_9MICO|nr:hypothetical protein [Homoserinimonas aerilata]TQL48493.1 hypothetical protein FB562_1587 [Homoserinimonas aerilata]